jgi:small-conductance mechanosensitive channel
MSDGSLGLAMAGLIVSILAAVLFQGWLILATLHIHYYGLIVQAILWLAGVLLMAAVMAWTVDQGRGLGSLGWILAAGFVVALVVRDFHDLGIYHTHLQLWCMAHNFNAGQQLYYHCPTTQ